MIRQSSEKKHLFNYIQALFLKAVALYQMQNEDKAHEFYSQALALAYQGGFFSVLLHEGEILLALIKQSQDSNIPSHFTEKLSECLGQQSTAALENREQITRNQELANSNNATLLEPLSQRELEVLKLIDQGLANKQIASKLSLAPATVKAHIRNIYGKIDAKSRTEALAKARSLGIFQ